MFGFLRLILASFVAASHAGIGYWFDMNFGVCAVTGFFIISGYVMTGLLRGRYSDIKNTTSFYMDRALRIYPQYLFFFLLYVVFFEVTRYQPEGYPTDHVTVKNFLLSASIIPLNWTVLTGSVFHVFDGFSDLLRYRLIHPAWSLGLELQYYILMPFILLWGLRIPILILSLAIYVAAAMLFINMPVYGYFFLPGVLFIFLSGSLMYDYNKGNKKSGVILAVVYFFMVVLCVVCSLMHKFQNYNSAVIHGFLVCIPLIFCLSKLKRSKIDEWLGNISYGVFLCHVLIIDAGRYFGVFDATNNIPILIVMSMIGGVAGYHLVEKPVHFFKQKIINSIQIKSIEKKIEKTVNQSA